MINPALSPLRREFHQKDGEKGILIAVPSTFPKTLTYLYPPLLRRRHPPSIPSPSLRHPGEGGRPGIRQASHRTHTHTHRPRITFRCGVKGRCVLKMPPHPPRPACSSTFLYSNVCLSCCHMSPRAEIPPVFSYGSNPGPW